MWIKSCVAVMAFAATAAQSHAAPILITQTFSNVDYFDYDVAGGVGYGQHPAGDWIFSGIVNSDAADLVGDADIGVFQLTDVKLTQAGLGLDQVGINNMAYLWFYPDRFGFSFNTFTASPWTRIIYEADHFTSAGTLAEYLALATAPLVDNLDSGFGPQWDGFELADGRRLYGWGFAAGIPTVSAVTVPETGTLSLMLGAFGALLWRMRGRRTVGQRAGGDCLVIRRQVR
jgi:hypothetical protein